KFEIRKDRADMVKIAMQAVRLFEPRAETKSLKINALFSRSPIEACVDHDRITQVWYNLLNNAMKFTKKGYVEVSVTDLETHVSCSVRDTGEGIPPEEISNIFNKFYQISGKPVPGEHGTGLGLPIAKAIVESHGGVLSVESTAGEGSIFTFVVPKSFPGM
ncbi:MAG: HAMP domain-containing sensor histidine kinase, partial [Syntrophales bacterium]|nr:HAMP domain-containing sensor histidine kinase [Syntrophales bacterium]